MRKVAFLGLGIEAGQTHSGLGDSADWARRLLQPFITTDHGNVESDIGPSPLKQADEIKNWNWQPYEEAIEKVSGILQDDELLLNWGGDHSVGISTVSGFLQRHPDGVVVWVDAHADINTPEASLTGNVHGMPVAFLLGEAQGGPKGMRHLRPDQFVYVGLRATDAFEEALIERLKVPYFPMSRIREMGMYDILQSLSEHVGGRPLHISFDIDSVDPALAPSTGVPEATGLNHFELSILAQALAKEDVKSLDVVEVNPALGDLEKVKATYQIAFQFLRPFLQQQGGKHVRRIAADQAKLPAEAPSCSQVRASGTI